MTLEQIKECCYDLCNVPFEIPDSYFEGVVGKVYHTDKAERPREVKLEITSFRGVCWNAVHYYGTMIVYGAPVRKGDEKQCHYGYLGEDTQLFKDKDIRIELWRYLTEKEHDVLRKIDRDIEVTNGWMYKADLIKFGKEVFKTRFKGDWKLVIKDYTK